MYQIAQILNNNIAIIWDDSNQRAIAMGKGIAFGKKKGELIPAEQIQNLFVLRNKESEQNFSILLRDIPLDFITTSYEIIEHAIKDYQYPVQEYIYATLTDHIYLSYQRILAKTYEESRLPDISSEYPLEYQIADEGIAIIQRRLGIVFPTCERNNIAYHFINAKGNTLKENRLDLDHAQATINLIQKRLAESGITRHDLPNLFDRLMIHLKYMIEREDEQEHLDALAQRFQDGLIDEYPEAYRIAKDIIEIAKESAGAKLTENEEIYLMIHIERLLQRKKEA